LVLFPVKHRLAVAAATAAVVLLTLGIVWLLPRRDQGAPPTPAFPGPEVAAVAPVPPSQEPLVARLLNQDLRLAETFAADEQVRVLADMANDLGTEALRLARQGPGEALAAVSGWYEQVVRRGVIGRARTLPSARQQQVVAPVVRQFQDTASAAERAVQESVPAVRPSLQKVQAAARGAISVLRGGPEAKSPLQEEWPRAPGGKRDLVGLLAMQGLLLAEEEDPLRRADYCADIGDHLAKTILLAAAPDAEQAGSLGKHLGEVLDRGVAANLRQVEMEEGDDERQAEFQRVSERGSRAVGVLQQKLEQAPAAARPGLERALEASRHGQEQAAQAGKGKGKPKRDGPPGPKGGKEKPPKGKPHGPPGMQKKHGKDRDEDRDRGNEDS
jgi:hypothetical protein